MGNSGGENEKMRKKGRGEEKMQMSELVSRPLLTMANELCSRKISRIIVEERGSRQMNIYGLSRRKIKSLRQYNQ